ncbi:MAG: transglycosylase domain-containing protein [Baekduia sp.]
MSRLSRQRRNKRNGGAVRALVVGLGVLGLFAILGAAAAAGWVVSVADSGPQLRDLKAKDQGAASEVFAANGERLGFITSDVLRTPIPGAKIPEIMRQAVVAVEDRRFYEHGGVDPEGILRAAIKNVTSDSGTQGASTLSMQLIRNLYTQDATRSGLAGVKRKIREARLAQELEEAHSGRKGKDWILNSYINNAPFGTVGGQEAIGVQAAARVYFRKSASDLKLHEAALLAGLPQAPSQYSPIRDPERAKARRDDVLRRMAKEGYISDQAARTAQAQPLGINLGSYYRKRRESYFFDYVRRQLVRDYGEDRVRAGGLKIYTTLDLKMQRAARTAIDNAVGGMDRSSAIASVDPRNGHLKALASSARYGEFQFDLASQGGYAAGSTFKVMVLMAAVDRGIDPKTTSYVSRPLKFNDPKYGPIDVSTYSGTYIGRANLVKATLTSDNSIYQQLDLDIGPPAVSLAARKMGIPKSKMKNYPSEGLGAIESGVSPLMMANAYATIASGGWRNKVTAVRRVCFPKGANSYRCEAVKARRRKAFSDGVTSEVTKILAQNMTGGTGTRAQIGCPAAGKTGTVDDFTDAWFVGYTPRLATSVWVGHALDRRTLGGGSAGGTTAAPIWGEYMKTAKGSYCGDFAAPKEPFVSQPFFGTYTKSGKDYEGETTTDETATTTETTPKKPGDKNFPSDQYNGKPKQPSVSPSAPKPSKPVPAGPGGGAAAPTG